MVAPELTKINTVFVVELYFPHVRGHLHKQILLGMNSCIYNEQVLSSCFNKTVKSGNSAALRQCPSVSGINRGAGRRATWRREVTRSDPDL